MTLHSDNLKATKKYGKGWYDSYIGKGKNHTLVITPSTYPNPIVGYRSMYPRKATFDSLTNEVREFYVARGLNVIIAGPEGLGADFTTIITSIIIFGEKFIAWLSAHYLTLLARLIMPTAKLIKARLVTYSEKRRLKQIRQVQTKLHLYISLYVDEGTPSEDLVAYVQQLVLSAKELNETLLLKMPYAFVSTTLQALDLLSDKLVSVGIEEVSDKYIHKALKQFKKTDPMKREIRLEL